MSSREQRAQAWAIRLADYEASGQTMKAWCATHAVRIDQLKYWKRKNKDSRDTTIASPTTPRLLPVSRTEALPPLSMVPKSKLGQAVTYSLNQWEKLNAFLLDGRLEIDNNRIERAIKPFVMGRKNWLFANTPRGAKASAVIYSVMETAKANGAPSDAVSDVSVRAAPAACRSQRYGTDRTVLAVVAATPGVLPH